MPSKRPCLQDLQLTPLAERLQLGETSPTGGRLRTLIPNGPCSTPLLLRLPHKAAAARWLVSVIVVITEANGGNRVVNLQEAAEGQAECALAGLVI